MPSVVGLRAPGRATGAVRNKWPQSRCAGRRGEPPVGVVGGGAQRFPGLQRDPQSRAEAKDEPSSAQTPLGSSRASLSQCCAQSERRAQAHKSCWGDPIPPPLAAPLRRVPALRRPSSFGHPIGVPSDAVPSFPSAPPPQFSPPCRGPSWRPPCATRPAWPGGEVVLARLFLPLRPRGRH